MRRSTRPFWPTHRGKRHRLTYAAPIIEERQPTPSELARDLVKRGLASERILDPTRSPRRFEP